MKDLEATVCEYQQAGNDWIAAKLQVDQLEEDKKSFLAAIMSENDNGKARENKLERIALASKQYRDFIASMCAARAEMLRKKVRFDALGLLFEARRSQQSFEKEKLARGIFHIGK